jgi:uncharacterized protein YjbJ (UPF0337 family)
VARNLPVGGVVGCWALSSQDILYREAAMKDQIKGKAEEVKGRVTGDKGEEMKGKARQMGDKARRAVRDVTGDFKDEADKRRDRQEP